MKRLLGVVVLLAVLCGCSKNEIGLDRALELRNTLLNSGGCSFLANITADYGEELYTFSVACQADEQGTLQFCVTEPLSIADISGQISQEGGQIDFDGEALAFSTLADGYLTPVSAPWVFVKTLRAGYINCCAKIQNGYQLRIDDSYQEDPLQLDIWTDAEMTPTHVEILWKNRRVLSMEIKDFHIL